MLHEENLNMPALAWRHTGEKPCPCIVRFYEQASFSSGLTNKECHGECDMNPLVICLTLWKDELETCPEMGTASDREKSRIAITGLGYGCVVSFNSYCLSSEMCGRLHSDWNSPLSVWVVKCVLPEYLVQTSLQIFTDAEYVASFELIWFVEDESLSSWSFYRRDLLCESARHEFEQARNEKDPEVVNLAIPFM